MQLIMKLSKLCNLRCVYCYEYDELAKKDRMSLEDIEFFFKHLSTYVLNRGNDVPVRLIMHGGEALLLPHEYLRSICQLRDRYFTANSIVCSTSVQSNLFKISEQTLDLLQELNIELGISLDVFGDQRLDIAGRRAQDKVLDNVQRLLDRKFPFGGISVLHALNVKNAVKTYHFYNELGISYRILPIFSHQDPPSRMQHLLLGYQETVTALQQVAKAQLSTPSKIEVLPLTEYFGAAVRYLLKQQIAPYAPNLHEWAMIINTNGDAYPHGDAYLPVGLIGNVFQQPIQEILHSEAHRRATQLRMQRAETCRRCKFDRRCSQIPMIESLPSERAYDELGQLQCPIAQPMIQFIVDELQRSFDAQSLLRLYAPQEALQSLLTV